MAIQMGEKNLAGQEFTICFRGDQQESKYWIPLLGDHQVDNAANAYSALRILEGTGYNIDDEK